MNEQERKKNGVGWIIGVVVIIAIIVILMMTRSSSQKKESQNQAGLQTATNSVSYACSNGKTIEATFNTSSTTLVTNPGIPPNPTGSVVLKLSGGQSMTLPQVLSADGVRFADSNSTTVFWNVGNHASLNQNGTTTYADCIEVNRT